MESSSFYTTCPSNASMSIYPDNTQASFKINLPKRLYLQNKYEVALVEIQYPVSWLTLGRNEAIEIMYGTRLETIQVKPMMYNTIEEVLYFLMSSIMKRSSKMNYKARAVSINEFKGGIIHYVLEDDCKMRMTQGLADVLGFTPNAWITGSGESMYPPDIRRGLNSMYVYCNVVDSQIVGDVYAPLLRTVAVRGQRNQVISQTFEKPHYVSVNTDEVSTIEINIKDDTGENISFQSGKVICKLHFRQKAI